MAPASATPFPSPETVSVSGEKKHITVLFADVAGSMDLQEQLDAEVWAQIMGRFVSILAEGVRKFGGTVDKFTGDGIMALFGAPVAQEDHARRACHAAWHLTKAIAEYSEELRETHDIELHVRLGLNSGEVVVGRVGDDVTLDPTALGHTVGLAQRMEAMAEPGKTYLTEPTARLVEGWFTVEHLGAFPVKGAREPLAVSMLGAPVSSPARSRVGASPLVGRERELAVLEDALAMAIEGQFQVVGVVGEAGVGKSRLCEEFAESCRARSITVRRTTGVSHGQDVPLLPILAFYRQYFGIIDGDDSASARRKVTERLLDLDPNLEEALPLIFDFLEVADRPLPPMAPEVRMRRIFEVVRRVTARRSERETLVLIFEDIHWFDPQSELFLERLIESFPGSRTLVVTNFRPEFSGRWSRHSYYRQVSLAPLSDSAVSRLLDGLVGKEPSLHSLARFVQERAGGNPFFVEELVRALLEEGTLVGEAGSYRLSCPLRDVKVPSSVQAVLAARIDRLRTDHKAVLQAAAVIGRTFGEALLARVAGAGDDLVRDALRELCVAELVEHAGVERTTEYRFWHPLTQEVAYASLLATRRCRLHHAVAVAIIELEPDRLAERSAVIASHFEQAGDHLEAARWNAEAAGWAWRTDLSEASRRLRATIRHVRRLPEGEQPLRLSLRAHARLIHLAARNVVPMAEADQLYADARTLSERLGDLEALAYLSVVYGSLQFGRGDVQQGFRLFVEASDMVQGTHGYPATIITIGLMFAHRHIGPLPRALSLAEEGVHMSGGDHRVGMEEAGYSLLGYSKLTRCEALLLSGRLDEARIDARDALQSATRYSPGELVVFALSLFPRLASYVGDGHGLAEAEEALSIADDLGSARARIRAMHGLAIAYLLAARDEEAAAMLKSALEDARLFNVGRFEESALLSALARAHVRLGHADAARRCADEAVTVARRQGVRVVECLTVLTRASVSRRTGAYDAGASDLMATLTLIKETGALTYEPFAREELARLNNDNGELREALVLYRQIGAAGHARRLEAEVRDRKTTHTRPIGRASR